MLDNLAKAWKSIDRCHFIGGSDARIIMGNDEAALIRLWKEKGGEIEPEDLSGDLLVQLGTVTERQGRLGSFRKKSPLALIALLLWQLSKAHT
jgi:hypothetical protein